MIIDGFPDNFPPAFHCPAIHVWSLCASPNGLTEHDIKAAELGEALRSLGLVLTQKELSDMKAGDGRGANWMHVIFS